MIVINIDNSKYYELEKGFAENVLKSMFKEYFDELYQANIVWDQLCEIWTMVSMNIPKGAVFVVKNEILYYFTEKDLEFKKAPKKFFEIDNSAHVIHKECFQKCYLDFNDMLNNYMDFKSSDITLKANVHFQDDKCWIEDLNKTLSNKKNTFENILKISFKDKLCSTISSEIEKLYKKALLTNNPIMFITRAEGERETLYLVTDELKAEEVSYSHIVRELQEIINMNMPCDKKNLSNRIYNAIMLPLRNTPPCIRIEKVQENGVEAILSLKDKDVHVFRRYGYSKYYAFLPIEHNSREFPYYVGDKVTSVYLAKPSVGLSVISGINKTMFNNMSCYVESDEKCCWVGYEDTRYNGVFRLNNYTITDLVNGGHFDRNSAKHKDLMSVDKKIEQEGSYAFFEIVFPE